MSYNLFLDDIREVSSVYPTAKTEAFIVVRSFEEFVSVIKEKGLPRFISFDNDLGVDSKGQLLPDGYAASKWLVYDSGLDIKQLKFYVHSANPVAAKQIDSLLNNYQAFLESE